MSFRKDAIMPKSLFCKSKINWVSDSPPKRHSLAVVIRIKYRKAADNSHSATPYTLLSCCLSSCRRRFSQELDPSCEPVSLLVIPLLFVSNPYRLFFPHCSSSLCSRSPRSRGSGEICTKSTLVREIWCRGI